MGWFNRCCEYCSLPCARCFLKPHFCLMISYILIVEKKRLEDFKMVKTCVSCTAFYFSRTDVLEVGAP